MFNLSHHRIAMLGFVCALLVALGTAQAAAPPPAPPLIVDTTQANLFYGAVPPNNPNGPVIVFVHGLSGTFMDWIEVNNCPPASSLPSGYNCTGGGNTMYDMAYQAGFNTVFPSMNLNLTPDINDIQTDAAMLQIMFPKILAHYNVSQVYFVGHSKGGLDIQDAIATPQWLNLPKAVFTLATPNQGDALATWIFLPANQQLGQLLGLLTPGEQSLQISNVLQLRTQWDPLFTNAGYPFYTLSGDTYLCQHSGGGTCGTQETGLILCSITGGTVTGTTCKGAPANDGLVTAPETLLPTSYAMDLGVLHSNHFGMELGINSFPFIYGRVIQQENSQPGLTRIANGGFGDQHNTWAWSAAWFKGKLYIGTGREEYCVTSATSAVQLGISALYPPAIGDCTPDFHHLPLQAEIWQYTPQTNSWVRVFQSENSLKISDNGGHTVATARDIGFRSLSLVTEPDSTQAIYAGGVTSGEIFTCTQYTTTGCVPQGTWAPPRILRSVDGVNWAPLPQQAGTFLGDLTKNGTSQYPIYSVRSGQQLNGILFLQVGDYPGVGRVIASLPGANPKNGGNSYGWASPPTQQLPVWILSNFNNFVYAGTGTPPGAPPATYGVFKTDGLGTQPYTWTQVVFDGAYATGLVSDYAMSAEIFVTPDCPGIGCLYFGTDRPNELIRIHPDTTGVVQVQNDPNDSWDLLIGNPRTVPPGQYGAGTYVAPLSGIGQYANNAFTGHFWRMGVGGQGLYMGTWDWSNDNSNQPAFAPLWSQEFGTDLFRTNDGTHWTSVSKIGMGDGNNTGSRSFAATPFGLYMGTARSVGGLQVFNVDNSTMDYNKDGVVDQNDVTILTEHLGNLASGPNDPMDLNQDGMLTQADVQLLKTQCSYPNCAVPAIRPATSTLAAPVLHSAPLSTGSIQKGGPISLDWQPVSGAYDYLVYRIALSPSETVAPPGINGYNPINGPGNTNAFTTALASACQKPGAARLQNCYPYTQPHSAAACGTTLVPCGYPGPPVLLQRVTGTTFSDTSITNLQQLYYVLAEDSSGGISAPSNMVGGPSLAAQ